MSSRYDSNFSDQSILQGGNAILSEAKEGLVNLQELNNQLKDNLLRLGSLGLGKQYVSKTGSCPNSPTSKEEWRNNESPKLAALKNYICHLQDAITNLVVEISQERTIYKERIRILELSLESTIKKYERKLKEQKYYPPFDPKVLEELKKITKFSQNILEKDSNEYSQEEITIMQTLKELSKKPSEQPKGMMDEYNSSNVSLCSRPSASSFTKPAPLFVQQFDPDLSDLSNNMSQVLSESAIDPNLSRRNSHIPSVSYEDIKNIYCEGITREQINFLSQNLLSKINVLDSVHQKQNGVDSQFLLNRKKQELALKNVKRGSATRREGRKALGCREANQAISDLSLSDISNISIPKNKENYERLKRYPDESCDYIQSLEREIESLKDRLAVCERNLMAKVYQYEDPLK